MVMLVSPLFGRKLTAFALHEKADLLAFARNDPRAGVLVEGKERIAPMKLPHNAHVAVVDGNRFMLLRNTGKPFEPTLEKVDQPELDPSNFSAGVRHQDDASQRSGATDLNELAHGAAVSEWLNAKAVSGDLTQLMVMADPKTLGEMRRHYHSELERILVGEIDKTVTGEPLEKIAKVIAES
ncbi:host attachment protein [Alteriqipengyuania abyssalis]|nr:host attachment protein [Alteriqipengyuania abyssalis]